MKKIFLLTTFLIIACIFFNLAFNLASYAYNPRYAVHTSAKDIEYKKKKTQEWYQYNNKNFTKDSHPAKLHWFNAKKEEEWQKKRALKWHQSNVKDGKFYLVHPEQELKFTKDKALRWHAKNSH